MKFRVSPETILKDAGIYAPEDIDLELVAFTLGAEVKFESMPDCEGQIIGTAERAVITVNNNVPHERQRFSLGHELGHWVNDKGQNLSYRCTTNDMKQSRPDKNNFRQQKEVRANLFSAQLLMPSYLIQEQLNASPITFPTVKTVADVFSCSVTSAAIRVIETTEYPCMLCCWSSDGLRRRFTRSGSLPEDVWPLGQLTDIRECLVASDGLDVDGDKWLDGDGAEEHTLHESTFFNGYDWYSLLWWKDEGQLLD